jgi:hypothetical protein
MCHYINIICVNKRWYISSVWAIGKNNAHKVRILRAKTRVYLSFENNTIELINIFSKGVHWCPCNRYGKVRSNKKAIIIKLFEVFETNGFLMETCIYNGDLCRPYWYLGSSIKFYIIIRVINLAYR